MNRLKNWYPSATTAKPEATDNRPIILLIVLVVGYLLINSLACTAVGALLTYAIMK